MRIDRRTFSRLVVPAAAGVIRGRAAKDDSRSHIPMTAIETARFARSGLLKQGVVESVLPRCKEVS